IDPVRIVALVRQRPELTLVPPAALRLTMDTSDGKRLTAEKPVAPSHQPSAVSHRRGTPGSRAPAPSWWTARARTGEVKPGFSKEEILRPARDNPRAPGGVFESVGGVLSDLLEAK